MNTELTHIQAGRQSSVHHIIDNIRANINTLQGFKRDIALFALGKTCISGSGSYGHFASTSRGNGNRQADTPQAFTDRFRENIIRINSLVFDNGKENKVFCKDILEVLPETKVDLAYFDPPYATEYSTTNYETSYHFVEGLKPKAHYASLKYPMRNSSWMKLSAFSSKVLPESVIVSFANILMKFTN